MKLLRRLPKNIPTNKELQALILNDVAVAASVAAEYAKEVEARS